MICSGDLIVISSCFGLLVCAVIPECSVLKQDLNKQYTFEHTVEEII